MHKYKQMRGQTKVMFLFQAVPAHKKSAKGSTHFLAEGDAPSLGIVKEATWANDGSMIVCVCHGSRVEWIWDLVFDDLHLF